MPLEENMKELALMRKYWACSVSLVCQTRRNRQTDRQTRSVDKATTLQ